MREGSEVIVDWHSKMKSLHLKYISFKVQNWCRIKFWKDTWLGTLPLEHKFCDINNILLMKENTVADCWNEVRKAIGIWALEAVSWTKLTTNWLLLVENWILFIADMGGQGRMVSWEGETF